MNANDGEVNAKIDVSQRGNERVEAASNGSLARGNVITTLTCDAPSERVEG